MNQISETKKQLTEYQAPRWSDFPQVGLYMDQIIPLLTQWLEPLYFDTDKACITPSMVNNYVKNSIVKPPVKKRYKAYHLGYLYVVMVLKQCFSLQEISELIKIYSSLEQPEKTEKHFNLFAGIFEAQLHEVMTTGKTKQSFFEDPTWQQILMTDAIRTVCCRLYAAAAIQQNNQQI